MAAYLPSGALLAASGGRGRRADRGAMPYRRSVGCSVMTCITGQRAPSHLHDPEEGAMGTWTALTNQPTFNASTMLLLTDGTVMCQAEGAQPGGG